MIEIPLFYFLIGYFAFLLIFILFGAINLYHIYSTGTFTGAVIMISAIMIVLTFITLGSTVFFLLGVDWSDMVRLGSQGSFL